MFRAFYDYFTDDGIRFSPTPTYARFELASAAKGEKPDFKLAWYPTWTRVSSSGDMGFDLGPWTISDLSDKKRPPRYGYFFSIWRKTQQGWRVVLDSGIRTPQPVPEQESAWQGKQKQVAGRKETKPGLSLLEAEQAFHDSVESTGAASAYSKSLAPEFSFLRNQSLPIRSVSEVEKALSSTGIASISMVPLKCEMASSGDVGYCIGSYLGLPKTESEKEDRGFYVHCWEKVNGEWKIFIDVTEPMDKR
jgi:ketosteroid isomerase-like protein